MARYKNKSILSQLKKAFIAERTDRKRLIAFLTNDCGEPNDKLQEYTDEKLIKMESDYSSRKTNSINLLKKKCEVTSEGILENLTYNETKNLLEKIKSTERSHSGDKLKFAVNSDKKLVW